MFRSGFVSIIGTTNVGKSTLLNTIIGQKLSIITPKPQTTRNRILGVKNLKDAQIVFMDTPGIHQPKNKLGEIIVKRSLNTLREIDIIYFLVDIQKPTIEDISIIETLMGLRKSTFLLINKIDLTRKENILPLIKEYNDLYIFDEVFPVSALKNEGITNLIKTTISLLPEGQKYYPEDIFTDQLERFMVSEIIREKVMLHTEQEVPHAVAVEVTDWKERNSGLISICANIYIEKKSQKGIIIGSAGIKIKNIGKDARIDIEKLLNTRVYLELFVKVKKNWRKDRKALRDLGFK